MCDLLGDLRTLEDSAATRNSPGSDLVKGWSSPESKRKAQLRTDGPRVLSTPSPELKGEAQIRIDDRGISEPSPVLKGEIFKLQLQSRGTEEAPSVVSPVLVCFLNDTEQNQLGMNKTGTMVHREAGVGAAYECEHEAGTDCDHLPIEALSQPSIENEIRKQRGAGVAIMIIMSLHRLFHNLQLSMKRHKKSQHSNHLGHLGVASLCLLLSYW
jgi:hypothetical protein